MQVWRNGRRAGFRFQWRDSCGFKSRHPHQTKRIYPCGMFSLFYKERDATIALKTIWVILALSHTYLQHAVNFSLFHLLTVGNHLGENTIKPLKMIDLIRFLWYTKHVNELKTGTGVSTEVSLPSGSGEVFIWIQAPNSIENFRFYPY